MKKIIKYSKKNDEIKKIKKHLSIENNLNLKKTLEINKLYNKQKKRDKCIICNFNLKYQDFISHQVTYCFCRNCGHLNGKNILSKRFNSEIYTSNNGKNYSNQYTKLYFERLKKIYIPKVKFMKDTIKEKINVLDIGCGAGHFVKACELQNIKAIGVDPNKDLIVKGNKNLTKNKIYFLNFNEIINEIINTKTKIVSSIFVLEHLEDPNKIFAAFKKSKAKYFYMAVPLVSFSTFVENAFPNIYPRNLGGSHTNLYSKQSINFICKKFRFKIIGEWWFGSDFSDLYRSIILSAKYKSKFYEKKFNHYFLDHLDKFQNILDRSNISSEVHLILKK